ncbi:MAG TPA: hypothetical protein VF708_12095 [Pyrinomonadaceae bacterium]|jgi:hypothetical protein
MSHFLFKICDTFQITNRGLVVATDLKEEDARAQGIRLKVGDFLELRRPDGSRVMSKIAGIGMLNPSVPNRPLDFMLSAELGKKDVPVGTEAWSSG